MMPAADAAATEGGGDAQLEHARALLHCLRHAGAAGGARVHPLLRVARDEWGGLCLEVAGPEAQAAGGEPGGSSTGIAADEELFAIPRALMLEPSAASSASAAAEGMSGGVGSGPDQLLKQPLAALAVALLRRAPVAGCAGPPQDYWGCLPPPEHLERVLPVLWHKRELAAGAGGAHDGGSEGSSSSADSGGVPAAQQGRTTAVARALQPSSAASDALRATDAALEAEWQAAGPWLPHGSAHGAYMWARGIVMSRAIHLWGGPTLVPLVDLLNHAYPPNVVCMVRPEDTGDDEQCSTSSRQFFVGYAIRALRPGAQLLWHYNSHSSDVGWLMGYGFVPTDARSSQPEAPPPTAALADYDVAIAALQACAAAQPQHGPVDDGGVQCVGAQLQAMGLDAGDQPLQLPAGMAAAMQALLLRERQALA